MLRDPWTGEPLLTSQEAVSHGILPAQCDSEPELACTSVRVDGSWTMLALAEDGSLRRLPESEASGWTGIGPLGLSRLEGDGTQVGRVGGQGEVQWTVDSGEVFAPRALHQHRLDLRGVRGRIGARRVGRPAGDRCRLPDDLTDFRTVAVAADTGDPVWGADATSTFCDVDVTGEPEDPLLACAWRSGEVETLQGDWTWSDVEMDLVRLDPAAGGVLWTVQAGEPEAGAEGWGPAIWVLDDEHVVWQEEPARFDIVVPRVAGVPGAGRAHRPGAVCAAGRRR